MNGYGHIPKIDPSRRAARPVFPDGSNDPTGFVPAHALRREGNPAEQEWAAAGLDAPDLDAMRAYRLGRLREQMRAADVAAMVVADPINVRYATDSTNMQVWCSHNAVRYAFVATEGPMIMFDFHGCGHLSNHLSLIDEIRPAISYIYFIVGTREDERARDWASEIADLVRQHGGGNMRLAVDRLDPLGMLHLQREGVEVVPGLSICEEARKIKGPDEIRALRRSVAATEQGLAQMWRALEPGMTENQLWSILHAESIARGGEWIETRLLASGPRTNPWFAECSDRVIEAGDVVAFDTDLIGPYGYCTDISGLGDPGSRADG